MGRDIALAFKIILLSTTLAAAIVLIHLEISAGGTKGCDSPAPSFPLPAANSTELDAVFRELMGRNWLNTSDRAVCVGPGSGPAAAAMRRMGFRAVVGASATACCGLPFEEASFDFAFSASLDRVRVPARVVLEMERVIRPGRFGAVFRRVYGPVRAARLMRAAAPVASLLRSSDVIGARTVNGSAMVVFQKRGGEGSDASAAWSSRFFDEITKLPLSLSGIVESVKATLWYEVVQ